MTIARAEIVMENGSFENSKKGTIPEETIKLLKEKPMLDSVKH